MRTKTPNPHPSHKPASSRTKPLFRRSEGSRASLRPVEKAKQFRMFLIPCSCGTTFAVAENYDRLGTAWSRYMICPGCGKRHDPKNRLLQMGFHPEGYWKVDDC
jgi:hypothetical protein